MKSKRKTMTSVEGSISVIVHEAHRFDPDAFYKQHRGGSGNVVVVFARLRGKEKWAIFGSIETAQKWAFDLGQAGDKWACAFVPFVVDEPEFGNATKN